MLSLEAKLCHSLEEMTESQRTKFNKSVKEKNLTGNVEPQVRLAESIIQESGYIRRNNGLGRDLTEAERQQGTMQAIDEVLFQGMERSRNTAKGIANLVEVNGNYVRKTEVSESLTSQQKKDAEFCRLIGLSESDSVMVAKSNTFRD